MQRTTATAFALSMSVALTGCTQLCPEGWEEVDSYTCTAPTAFVRDAETALGTGIFGYVVACEDDDDEDSYECVPTGLKTSGAFTLSRQTADDPTAWEDIEVSISSDSTFRAELPSGAYSFSLPVISAAGPDDEDSSTFTLSEGDALLLRVVVDD